MNTILLILNLLMSATDEEVATVHILYNAATEEYYLETEYDETHFEDDCEVLKMIADVAKTDCK